MQCQVNKNPTTCRLPILFFWAIPLDLNLRGLTTPSPGTTWVARDRPRSLCKGPALSGSQASASLSPRPVSEKCRGFFPLYALVY